MSKIAPISWLNSSIITDLGNYLQKFARFILPLKLRCVLVSCIRQWCYITELPKFSIITVNYYSSQNTEAHHYPRFSEPHRSEVWQYPRQHCWESIVEWWNTFKYTSCSFSFLQNLTTRCALGCWNDIQFCDNCSLERFCANLCPTNDQFLPFDDVIMDSLAITRCPQIIWTPGIHTCQCFPRWWSNVVQYHVKTNASCICVAVNLYISLNTSVDVNRIECLGWFSFFSELLLADCYPLANEFWINITYFFFDRPRISNL